MAAFSVCSGHCWVPGTHDSAWHVGGAWRVHLADGPPLPVHGAARAWLWDGDGALGALHPPGDRAQCPALLHWPLRQLYAHSRSPKPAMEAEATRRTPQEA